jgi:hypothetical protein
LKIAAEWVRVARKSRDVKLVSKRIKEKYFKNRTLNVIEVITMYQLQQFK